MARKFDNRTVIEKFFDGVCDIESHTGNVWVSIDGKRLMNYGTCLVERDQTHSYIVNETTYSNTTSKIQSYIRHHLTYRDYITVSNVQMYTHYLKQAANEKVEWLKGVKPVKIINYFDVCGNKKDGWEINNLCEEPQFNNLTIHEDATAKQAFQLLKECGFFNKYARITQVDIEPLYDFGWEFTQRKDGKPICRIEFIHSFTTQEVK